MLQTLTDISDEELRALAEKSVKKLDNIAADKDTMLRVFGVKDSNREKNHFQKCVGIYNELLCQEYSKQRCTRGYKRYKETSGLIEWKECQIFHSIFT